MRIKLLALALMTIALMCSLAYGADVNLTVNYMDVSMEDLDGIQPDFEYRWRAENADFVLVLGLGDDTRRYPVIDTLRGVNKELLVVAVGPNGCAIAPVSRKWFKSRPGTGRYGMRHSLVEEWDPATLLADAYRFHLDCSFSEAAICEAIEFLLQSKGYSVTRRSTGPNLRQLLFYTPQLSDLSVWDSSATANTAEKPRIERQVALTILISREDSLGTCVQWSVEVSPYIMMRYRREGGIWIRDPDEYQEGLRSCCAFQKGLELALERR